MIRENFGKLSKHPYLRRVIPRRGQLNVQVHSSLKDEKYNICILISVQDVCTKKREEKKSDKFYV